MDATTVFDWLILAFLREFGSRGASGKEDETAGEDASDRMEVGERSG